MFEKGKIVRTCVYVALICYFLIKVWESMTKFHDGKISVAEEEVIVAMGQVPLERDINIPVNGCSGFATSTQNSPFVAMLISLYRGTYLIVCHYDF